MMVIAMVNDEEKTAYHVWELVSIVIKVPLVGTFTMLSFMAMYRLMCTDYDD